MATVDFTGWATPSLTLTLGGKTYEVEPPSVERGQMIVACAAVATSKGGDIAPELKAMVESLEETPLGHVTLGEDVYNEMVADGVDVRTLTRIATYAMWYWAHGKPIADAIALTLWRQDDADPEGDDSPGEAQGR